MIVRLYNLPLENVEIRRAQAHTPLCSECGVSGNPMIENVPNISSVDTGS